MLFRSGKKQVKLPTLLKTVWFWPTDIENQSIRYRRKKMKKFTIFRKKKFFLFFSQKWSHRKKNLPDLLLLRSLLFMMGYHNKLFPFFEAAAEAIAFQLLRLSTPRRLQQYFSLFTVFSEKTGKRRSVVSLSFLCGTSKQYIQGRHHYFYCKNHIFMTQKYTQCGTVRIFLQLSFYVKSYCDPFRVSYLYLQPHAFFKKA